jgi:hypothetical protein
MALGSWAEIYASGKKLQLTQTISAPIHNRPKIYRYAEYFFKIVHNFKLGQGPERGHNEI